MKTYTVIWHYCANHDLRIVQATSPEDAADLVCSHFSPSFHQEGKIFVFEGSPALTVDPQKGRKS